MRFTSIHNHTDFSNLRLLDCIIKPVELIDRALELDYSGVAITDHEIMSGLPEGLKYIIDLKEKNPDDQKIQDFKFILGNEVYIVNDLKETKEDYKSYGNGFYHLVLLAKDKEGYHLLKRLSSQAWVNSYRGRGMERVPLPKDEMKRIIGKDKGHLIASSACLGSEFARAIIARFLAKQQVKKSEKIIAGFREKKKSAYDIEQEQLKLELGNLEVEKYQKDLDNMTAFYVDLFGKDDYYIELQPSSSAEQLAYNREAVDYAKENGLQWIVSTDSHYVKKEDAAIHEAYLHSKDGDREVAEFYSSTYMQTIEEITKYLEEAGLDEDEIKMSIENTQTIYDKCENYTIFKQQEIPLIEIEDKLDLLLEREDIAEIIQKMNQDRFESVKAYIESDNCQEKYFIYSCVDGLIEKELECTDERIERINDEIKELIGISEKMGRPMAQYYVTAQKLVEIMWNEGDSLVGPARGSVTGFFTAYLLDIVQINAMDWGLPHWRHISASRPEYPQRQYGEMIVNCARRCVA